MDQWQLDDGILPGEVVDLNAVSARASASTGRTLAPVSGQPCLPSIHCSQQLNNIPSATLAIELLRLLIRAAPFLETIHCDQKFQLVVSTIADSSPRARA